MDPERGLSDAALLGGALFAAIVIVGVAYFGQSAGSATMFAAASASNNGGGWCGTPSGSSGNIQEQCKPGCEYQVSIGSGGASQVTVIKWPATYPTPEQQKSLLPGQVTYTSSGGQTSVQTCSQTGTDASGNPTYSSFSSLNGNAGVMYTENAVTAAGNGISNAWNSIFGGSGSEGSETVPPGTSYLESQTAAQANIGPNYPYGSYTGAGSGPDTSLSAYANPSIAGDSAVNVLDNPADQYQYGQILNTQPVDEGDAGGGPYAGAPVGDQGTGIAPIPPEDQTLLGPMANTEANIGQIPAAASNPTSADQSQYLSTIGGGTVPSPGAGGYYMPAQSDTDAPAVEAPSVSAPAANASTQSSNSLWDTYVANPISEFWNANFNPNATGNVPADTNAVAPSSDEITPPIVSAPETSVNSTLSSLQSNPDYESSVLLNDYPQTIGNPPDWSALKISGTPLTPPPGTPTDMNVANP